MSLPLAALLGKLKGGDKLNVSQVINILSDKTAGKSSLNGKVINMVDFKKLISGLLSNKKSQIGTEISEDILNLLISQLGTGALTENKTNLNEIKVLDMEKTDISSNISKLSLEDIKPLLNENLDLPEIGDKTISTEDFKKKLTEFIAGIQQNNEKQADESKKLEEYGNFKKTVLQNRKNDMFNLKEKTIIIPSKIQENVPVKTEAHLNIKDTKEVKLEEKHIIKVKASSSSDAFSSAINKIELKNTNIKEESQLLEINKESLKQDVIKTISFMKDNDVKNLTVKIIPKELGEITIELIYTADKISAKLTSNTNSTFQLLDQNLSILNSELSKNGINIQNVSVNLYSGDFSEHGGNQGQEYSRKKEKREIKEIEPDDMKDEFSNINTFA